MAKTKSTEKKPVISESPLMFARKIADECKTNGIRATAERCGMAASSLSDLCNDPRRLTAAQMELISKKLGFAKK